MNALKKHLRKPRLHVDEIHLEFYDCDDVDLFLESLRLGLIEDLCKVFPYYREEIICIVNAWFGVV